MTIACYVYYRSAAADRDEVARRVQAMQARLLEQTGVAGRLLRRAEDAVTWMEVYEAVPDAPLFEALLDGMASEFGLDGLLAPGEERHIERFVPCV